MEVGLNTETIAGGGVLTTAALVFLRRVYTDWMKGRPELASASAVEAQFKALREQLASQQAEIKELRAEITRMDLKVHRTQTKLTRTEMLTRQSFGLINQHGISVPQFMQDELDDLLKVEKEETPEPKEF